MTFEEWKRQALPPKYNPENLVRYCWKEAQQAATDAACEAVRGCEWCGVGDDLDFISKEDAIAAIRKGPGKPKCETCGDGQHIPYKCPDCGGEATEYT